MKKKPSLRLRPRRSSPGRSRSDGCRRLDQPLGAFRYGRCAELARRPLRRRPRRQRNALDAAPEHQDFIWLRAEILTRRGHEEDAIALVDKLQDAVENPVELLVTKAHALSTLSRGKEDDPAKLDEALATFEAARALDPENVDAQYLTGLALSGPEHRAEAYAFLKTAAAMTPNPPAHSAYWRAIMALQDQSPEEKQAEIEAEIDALLAHREPTTYLLYEIARQYGTLELVDKQKQAEDRLLEIDPANVKAEWVLVNRIRRYERAHRDDIYETKDPARRTVWQEMLTDFIAAAVSQNGGCNDAQPPRA